MLPDYPEYGSSPLSYGTGFLSGREPMSIRGMRGRIPAASYRAGVVSRTARLKKFVLLAGLCLTGPALILLSATPCRAGMQATSKDHAVSGTHPRAASSYAGGRSVSLPNASSQLGSRNSFRARRQEGDIFVAMHYAPWFESGGAGWVGKVGGKTTHTAYTPLLGRYDNRDPATLTRHIAWAKAYGIDAFMIEWCGVRSDKFPASMNEVVSLFPGNPNFPKIKFFFVYSFITGLRRAGEKTFDPVDFDDADRVNKLISDVKYAARTYFPLSNQLRIGGRPVIYLWALGAAKGNYTAAITRLRKAIKTSFGYDLYIIGDDVGFNHLPGLDWASVLDAFMPYMMLRVDNPIRNYKLETISASVVAQYRNVRNVCADLGLKFIPCGFTGFNPIGAPWCYDEKTGKLSTPVVARSVSGFRDFIGKARSLVDPDLRMFYLTSWSEWNEGTNLEPSTQFGFDYLRAVKDLLTKAAPAALTETPTITFKFKRIWQPETGDKRWLAAAFDKIEFLDAADKVLLSLNIGMPAARPPMGAGWFPDEQGPWDGVVNFCWAGDIKKYATLRLDLPAGTAAVRFKALQIEDQSIAIYRNGVKKADVPVDIPWRWVVHKAAI